MNIIKERKINSGIVKAVLYLSFCFAGWYTYRSEFATAFGSSQFSFLVSDVFAFLFAGLIPFVVYLLAVKFLLYSLKNVRYLPINEMIYSLPYFYIGANIVTGLFGILYFFYPLASFWGGIIVPMLSTAAFFIWYLAFICKNYVKNYNWRTIVLFFGRMYIFIALILTGINLLVEIL